MEALDSSGMATLPSSTSSGIPPHQSNRCYIDTLPSELICKLFRILKDEGVNYITPCLAVSKSWHGYGQQIVWSSLALNELNYDAFVCSLAFGGSSYRGLNAFEMRCSCVKNWEAEFHCKMKDLHIRWDFHRLVDDTLCSGWYHVDVHHDKEHLQETLRRKLQQILISMRHAIASGLRSLSTLSLTIKNEPTDGDYCYCHECILSPQYFANIVRALPTTCQSLELDTGGADKGHIYTTSCKDPGHSSLCEALHGVLPQLHHLRLRVAAICPDFFYGPHRSLPLKLEASACQLWAKICDLDSPSWISNVSEPLDLGPSFHGPTLDLWNWQEWGDLLESEKQVSLHSDPSTNIDSNARSGK